jgi:single-strand DNA-binding protein
MNNIVNLIGRLGEKPTCRTLNDGARVANLKLATDDGYKGRDGQWVKRTTWHRLTVFGDKRVDYIEQHYGKGDLVQFTGRLGYSQSERDGTKYHNPELTGSTSLLATVSRENSSAAAKPKATRKKAAQEPQYNLDDEVPF